MPRIEPADYNRTEAAAKLFMPNRVIEAYQPEAFSSKGYPMRISGSGELIRYVDAMYEGGTHIEDVVEQWLGGLTEEEFWLLRTVCESASDMVFEVSGRRAIPARSALPALICLRYVRHLFPTPDHVIMELGPGSGALGAMLSLLGYSYFSMDVTQAFYVYQSHLFNHVAGERFIELASDPRTLSEFRRLSNGQNVHIPWWKFVPDNPEELQLDVDCVIVSGAIAEMHMNAIKYLTRQACRWFGHSQGEKAFIIVGPGDDSINPMSNVLSEIQRGGLEIVYADKGGYDGQLVDRDIIHILQPC